MPRIDYAEGDVIVCTDGGHKGHLFTCTGFMTGLGLCPKCGQVDFGTFIAEHPPLAHDDAWCPYHFRKAFTPDVEVSREIVEPIPVLSRFPFLKSSVLGSNHT